MSSKIFTVLSCVRLALDDHVNRLTGSYYVPSREEIIRESLQYGSRLQVTREEVEKVLDTPLAELANLK